MNLKNSSPLAAKGTEGFGGIYVFYEDEDFEEVNNENEDREGLERFLSRARFEADEDSQ